MRTNAVMQRPVNDFLINRTISEKVNSKNDINIKSSDRTSTLDALFLMPHHISESVATP